MKRTKSTMKRIFNSPGRKRKGASPLRGKRSKPDDEPNNNNNNDNNKPRKFKIGNNRIPSSSGSVDDSLGLPPQITRRIDGKSKTKKTKATNSKKTSKFRPISSRAPSPPLDSRLDDTKDNIQTSFSHVDDATEESHRRNAFLYLDRYEDMVRAQDAEDDATITHLRPIFYTIRRLATQNQDDDSDASDASDASDDGIDQTKVKVEQKMSTPKAIVETTPKQVVKKNVETKNDNNPGEPSKLLKTTSVEVIASNEDMAIEATSFDVGGDGTDDDDDKDVDANEPLFPEGDVPDETSFTANHDQTFMDGGTNGVGGTTSSKIPTGSTINMTRDTSFTANHDQTFMKPGVMGSDIKEITVITKGIPEIDRDDDSDEFVNEDEYGFVSTGYLDTTTNTITNLASIKNDHNILLPFSAISHFVHRIEAMNEAHEGSEIPPIASGPKSDYHILQTDAQLMLILTTIVEMVEDEEEEKEGEGSKEGLTFAEFVHVYKSVIAGMQTLQMLPPPAGNSTPVSDPYNMSDVRDMTRERTLQMIRAFTTKTMSELMAFFGQEDSDSTASPSGSKRSPKKSRSLSRGGADSNTQELLDSKDKELKTLKDNLKNAESKNKSGGGSPFKVMLLSLLIGFGAGYQYFTHQSNELNKIDIIQVKSELDGANKQIKSFQSEIDDLVVDLSTKDGALVKKDEEFLKCEKTLRTIEDYYNGDVTKLKLELEECQESSRFNPSESNVQEAKMVIKSSQSLQKVVMHRQVMTAVGTALIAAVPSFLKFLLNVLFF